MRYKDASGERTEGAEQGAMAQSASGAGTELINVTLSHGPKATEEVTYLHTVPGESSEDTSPKSKTYVHVSRGDRLDGPPKDRWSEAKTVTGAQESQLAEGTGATVWSLPRREA